VTEVAGYDKESSSPIPNEIIKWDAFRDRFNVVGKSVVLKKIAENTGMSELDMRKEFDDRVKVLCWLLKKKVDDYVKITSIFNLFYTAREYLMERIGEEI
jgi:flagellar protein FlaI